MSDDAYTRIALRFRTLDAIDREWLLQQLDVQDCRLVSDALQRLRMNKIAVAVQGAATTDSHALRRDYGGDRQCLELIMSMESASVLGILPAQPDWVIAVVLGAAQWPWAEAMVEKLGPERIGRVRLLLHELRARVKPTVRDAVLRLLLTKIESQNAIPAGFRLFDAAIDRAIRPAVGAARQLRDSV